MRSDQGLTRPTSGHRRAALGAAAAVPLALLIGGGTTLAYGPVDQSLTQLGDHLASICEGRVFAQTFTAGVTGSLDAVSLHLGHWQSPGSALVEITSVNGSGAPTSTALASTSVPITDIPGGFWGGTWVVVPFATPTHVVAGTKYAVTIGAPSCASMMSAEIYWDLILDGTTDPYTGGDLYLSQSGGAFNRMGHDASFVTYVTEDAKPHLDASDGLTFGTIALGDRSVTKTVTITNSGDGAGVISDVYLDGTNAAAFDLVNDACTGTLPPTESCALDVRFSPLHQGGKTASLCVASDAAGSPLCVDLTGTGGPDLTTNVSDLAFGSQRIGSTSAGQSVTATNVSHAPIAITSAHVAGAAASWFPVTADTCSGTTLTPGDECTVTVAFSPVATGDASVNLVLDSDAPDAPLTLPMTGHSSAPVIEVAPTSKAFGDVLVGATPTVDVAISNTGDAIAHLGTITLTGAGAGAFGVSTSCASTDLRTTDPACQVTVTFHPTTVGTFTASLAVRGTDPVSLVRVALSGTGYVVPVLTVSPSSATFASSQAVGTTSDPVAFTVTNPTGGAVAIADIRIAGTARGHFTAADTCPASLGAGKTCTVSVAFAPVSIGSKSAQLVVEESTGAMRTMGLSGTAIAGFKVVCADANLGSVWIGKQSAAHECAIVNLSDDTLSITSVAITPSGTDFSILGEECAGLSIAPDDRCPVSVSFAPTTVGSLSARLVATAGPAALERSVVLSGTGRRPPITVDDLDSSRVEAFVRVGPDFRERATGYLDHTFWNDAASSVDARGTWTATLPVAGTWRVLAYIPGIAYLAHDAHYQVWLADGTIARVTIDQAANAGGWVELGTFSLSTAGKVRLTDRVDTVPVAGLRVAFDAIRFVQVP